MHCLVNFISEHLGIFLDVGRLAFDEYLKVIDTKMNKAIGLLWKLQNILQLTGKSFLK